MSRSLSIRQLLEIDPGPDLLARWARRARRPSIEFEAAREAILRHTRIHPGEALRATEHLRASLNGSLDAVQGARLQLVHAHALRSAGRVEDADRAYSRAWNQLQSAGARDELGRAAIGWVDALALMGRPARAREVARAARRHLDPSDQAARARLEMNLGNAWWSVGRNEEAGRCYARARRRFVQSGDPLSAAYCALNLGNVKLRAARFSAARTLYAEAHRVFARRKLDSLTLRARYSVLSVDLIEGRWSDNLEEMELLLAKLSSLEDDRAVAAVHRELAELLSALGITDLATRHAAAGHRLYRQCGLRSEAAQAAFVHGRLLASLGRHHDSQVRLQGALKHWEQTGNRWASARVGMEIARNHLRRGEADSSYELLQRVLPLLRRRDPKGDGAVCRALLAQTHLARGKPGLAARLAEQAYREARSYPARLSRPEMALCVARGRLGADDRAAVRWAKKAVVELDGMVRLFGSRFMDCGGAATRERLYQDAIEIVLSSRAQNAQRVALDLIGKAHSATLIDDLLQGRGNELQTGLRASIAKLRDELLSPNDPSDDDVRFRTMRSRVDELRGRLEPTIRRGQGPLARKILERDFSVWSRRLGERSLVLYDRGRDGWRAFVVDERRSVRCVELPEVDAALQDAWVPLRMLIETIAHVPRDERDEFSDQTRDEADGCLQHLGRALLDPLKLDRRPLTFVPSGPLHGIPLEAIAEHAATSATNAAVTRLPHPALLENSRPRRRQGGALVLHGSGDGMRHEGYAVARQLRSAGYDVTRSGRRQSLAGEERQLGVLHIAAHGAFDRQRWFASGFQLSDGWTGYEHLPAHELRDGLLFLGSCESGRVREIPGAELDGWTAAGMGAGARELIVTLWKVDDRTSLFFSRAFYRSWLKGATASESARIARQALRLEFPHVFNWAPFVSVG